MTTIYIEHGTSQETREALEAALAEQAKRNPAWNGADFKIGYAETVWIDTDDVMDGAVLLHNIVFPTLASTEEEQL